MLAATALNIIRMHPLQAEELHEGQRVEGTTAVLKVNHPNPDESNVARQVRGEVAAQLLGSGLFRSILRLPPLVGQKMGEVKV